MESGLQVIDTKDGVEGVEDESRFLADLTVTAEDAGWPVCLEGRVLS